MFKQLQDKGEFRMGHIALSQAGQSLASATPTPIKEAIKGGLTHMVTSFQKRHAENLELDRKAVEEGRMSPEKFQKYQENAQVVPKLVKEVDQGFEAISKATNTSRIISDTAVEALLTGGAAAVVKQGSRLAIKKGASQALANQARQLTISPQLARRTVANELSDIESITGLTSSKVTKTAEVVKPKSKRVLLTEAEKRANRRQHQANRKFREALPSDADLLSEFKAQGIPEELIPLYKKNARSGWNRTRKAASQQTVDTHAGHQRNLLASGDPLKQGVSKLDTTATTGRTAKLEYGPDNLKKGAREGSMNQHVSDITGMPSNWRKDIKQWYQHHRGEPSLHYDSDWTVKQMDLLEAIPENWSKSKVMARIEQIRQLAPTTAGQQYKAIQKELAEEMMRESQRLNDLF